MYPCSIFLRRRRQQPEVGLKAPTSPEWSTWDHYQTYRHESSLCH